MNVSVDYRRWTDLKFELVREALVKASVEDVAKKVNRTPKATQAVGRLFTRRR